MNDFTLTFYGGVGSVTGANFVLAPNNDIDAARTMVDCGLMQGCDFCDEKNREDFAYDPATIDYLFVTHAHIDHIGRIPKLVQDGFSGPIYSTPTTKEMAKLMFDDALSIMHFEKEEKELAPLYAQGDVTDAMSFWETIPYYEHHNIGGYDIYLKDAGHILGSAMIELTHNDRKIVFTGDLGNSPSILLRDTDAVTDASYMVMESVSGDRNHPPEYRRREKLRDIINNTMARGGTVLIPAFSIERTQELLYALNELIEGGELDPVPVYLDSPLAIEVTRIYKQKQDIFKEAVRDDMVSGDKIFDFSNLHLTESVEASKEINTHDEPKIIIAGSGMSEGGRILHHEKRYLPDADSTILFVGYQAPKSRGRKIQEGADTIRIHDDTIPVRANIAEISSFSAHKDSDDLLAFVSETADTAEEIFVTMGEPKSSTHLAQRIRDFLGVQAKVPKEGEQVTIEL